MFRSLIRTPFLMCSGVAGESAQESLANVRWQSRAIAAGGVSGDQARVTGVFVEHVEPSVQG